MGFYGIPAEERAGAERRPACEGCFRCPQSGEPYLVFSEPASVLLEENPHNRIPIVMDPPHAHDESKSLTFVCRLFLRRGTEYAFTARVLYADGGIETISREEAERLVAERHPVPMRLSAEK